MKLNEQQKMFADYYIESLNATESYKRAGYKAKGNAREVNASRLLSNAKVNEYIAKVMQEKAKERIATQDEVLEYLTRVVRGEEREQEAKFVEGQLMTIEVPAALRDRTKAAELLGKRYALFVEKQEHSGPGGGPIEIGTMTEDEKLALIRKVADKKCLK